MNNFSSITKEIVKNGLDMKSSTLSKEFIELAKEVYSVPEKPNSFISKFFNDKDYPSGEVAILVTGGLDSSVLYFRAKQKYGNMKAFYIDVGQSFKDKELKALNDLDIGYILLKPTTFNNSKYWEHILPGRNLYFFSLIAEQIRGGKILFGSTNGEMPKTGGDKSKRFIKLVNKLFKKLPYPVKIETPLEEETKTDLVAWWIQNFPSELLNKTISCFNDNEGHCGRCQACLRKALAYINNGLYLETNTNIRIGCNKYIEKYKEVFNKALKEKDFSHYSKRRCLQDLRAIKKIETNL